MLDLSLIKPLRLLLTFSHFLLIGIWELNWKRKCIEINQITRIRWNPCHFDLILTLEIGVRFGTPVSTTTDRFASLYKEKQKNYKKHVVTRIFYFTSYRLFYILSIAFMEIADITEIVRITGKIRHKFTIKLDFDISGPKIWEYFTIIIDSRINKPLNFLFFIFQKNLKLFFVYS